MISNTFITSLPALMNLGSVLGFFMLMYSIIGVILFGDVKRTGMINDHLNFEYFQNAFLTLFIVATGDSWNSIMNAYAMTRAPNYVCMMNPEYDDYAKNNFVTLGCGNMTYSVVFFISYVFIIDLIFLKLFIAIVLQSFE